MGSFTPAAQRVTRRNRLVALISGEPKTGKTHFALDFPAPVRLINFDYGVDELLPKFEGKDIGIADVLLPEDIIETDPESIGAAIKLFNIWHVAFNEALDEVGEGTVVVDTATDLWQLVQTAKIGEVLLQRWASERKKKADFLFADVKRFQYDFKVANAYMGGMVKKALNHPTANVVFLARMKEKYDGAQPTGDYVYQGWGDLPYLTQVHVKLFRKQDPKAPTKMVRVGKIMACRYDEDVIGTEMPNLNYERLKALCF